MTPTPELPEDHPFGNAPPPPKSQRQKDWEELLKLAPELRYLIKHQLNESRPPPAMTDKQFVSFLVALLHPVNRAIFESVIGAIVDARIDEKIDEALYKEES